MTSKKDAVWTTKDGTCVKVKDMEDSHLLNAYRMVVKASCEIDYAIDTMPDGLLPATAFQEQRTINDWCGILGSECKLRKLKT